MNTLQVKKQDKYYNLHLKHFVFGVRKVKYVLLELHPTYEDTLHMIYRGLLIAVLLLIKNKKSVMLEYLPKSKWMTLNDKRIFSDQNSLLTSWLQMLVRELIGNEKVFKPFWTEQCKDISQRLWLPTEIDSVDSPLNFWSGSSNTMESHSWFSNKQKNNPQIKNLQTIFSPSYMFIHVDKWENEGIRTRKIRIYPNASQKILMKKWMGTRRFVYNKSLEKIKKNEEKLNFYTLRNKIVTAKNNTDINDWELETPKDIRAGAIRDMIKNHKTAFSNLKNNNIKGFKMGFCSKKDTPSIEIPKSALKNNKGLFLYKSYIPDKIKVGRREKMNFSFDYDCRLQLKNNQWFLLVPIKTKVSKIEDRLGYCSLDPGVRTFQTVYSEEMVVQIKIRKELIKKLQTKLDCFQSLRDKKIISRYRFRRKERRIYTRINNLIDDLHHKTCNFLTKTFNHIILPIFESQKMTKGSKIRGLNRDLLQLKHFLFKERLKAKCELRQCSLDICTEEYTSKTCGVCGKLTSVNGKDVFTCDYCDLVIDRDVNGARNIAIKRLNELF